MPNGPSQVLAQLGYAADPAIEMLLPKDLLAQIKIRKIDIAVRELQANIELLNFQKEALMKEYKAR